MTEQRSVQPDLSQSLLLQALEQMSGIDTRLSTLSGQVTEIIREQQRVAEGRKGIYDKINRIDGLAAEMARIAPLVADHEKKHNQAAGAVSLGRSLMALAGGVFGAAATLAVKWLTDGGQPPHHP